MTFRNETGILNLGGLDSTSAETFSDEVDMEYQWLLNLGGLDSTSAEFFSDEVDMHFVNGWSYPIYIQTQFSKESSTLLKKGWFSRCSGAFRPFSKITLVEESLMAKGNHLPSPDPSDIASLASDCRKKSPDPKPNNSVWISTLVWAIAPIHTVPASLPRSRRTGRNWAPTWVDGCWHGSRRGKGSYWNNI